MPVKRIITGVLRLDFALNVPAHQGDKAEFARAVDSREDHDFTAPETTQEITGDLEPDDFDPATDGDDELYAEDETDLDEAIEAGNDADQPIGLGFGDALDGGGGDDLLVGGQERDLLAGGAGADILIGGRGADFLYGDSAVNIINRDWSVAESISAGADGVDNCIYTFTNVSFSEATGADAGDDVLFAVTLLISKTQDGREAWKSP